MTNPQCIHIPDGSVVVSGELFDMACAAIAERDKLLAEIAQLDTDACGERAERESWKHNFKNFHRLLCERFGYGHDEKDWLRDQLSLIEWIANRPRNEPCEQHQVHVDSAPKGNAETGRLILEAAGIDPSRLFANQAQPDTRSLTHQEIFSAVYHHAKKITRLTEVVPVQCTERQPMCEFHQIEGCTDCFGPPSKSVSAHLPKQAQWCGDPNCAQCASQRTSE